MVFMQFFLLVFGYNHVLQSHSKQFCWYCSTILLAVWLYTLITVGLRNYDCAGMQTMMWICVSFCSCLWFKSIFSMWSCKQNSTQGNVKFTIELWKLSCCSVRCTGTSTYSNPACSTSHEDSIIIRSLAATILTLL